MGTLGPVVEAPVRAVLDIRHDLPFRRSIGTQLVGDDALGARPCFFSSLVSRRGLENITVLIELPNIIGARPLPAQLVERKLGAELLPPPAIAL
ncbi:hypothetical protein AJ88_22275 [Mesorhizobium amorphae CCBAU 01583]|nr:hypothetical protein AJ88_22275 [Mesorhizobium amorphae CCBAU 01583]